MIEVCALTQRYGAFAAVRELSFSIAAGEVVGFLGPNGAGKSTTLRVLAAFLEPSEGRAAVGGFDVARQPVAARRVLGYLPEGCALYDEMTVRAFLTFVARVRGLSAGARRSAVGRVAEATRLDEVLERAISDLSRGFRQRVGIAQALLHEPPVLILDEPTSGLDPNQVQEVRRLVRELGESRTVLFSSHVLSEVEATCSRVLVIQHGRLVADDGLERLARRITGGALTATFGADASSEAPWSEAEVLARLRALEGVAAAEPRACVAGAGALRVRVVPSPAVADLDARLFRFAVREQLLLTELAPLPVGLEDVFAGLTGGTGGGALGG